MPSPHSAGSPVLDSGETVGSVLLDSVVGFSVGSWVSLLLLLSAGSVVPESAEVIGWVVPASLEPESALVASVVDADPSFEQAGTIAQKARTIRLMPGW
jgi:hypothetical protein